MSGVYHLLEKGGAANYVLRILDYTGIYGLIAGTFTPVHLILFRGLHRWLILAIVWTLAITGLTLTAIFFDDIPHWLSLSFFLGLGWMGFLTFWFMYKLHSKKLVFYLISGGLFYTIGAICEFLNWPIIREGIVGAHEVFHIFVILGALMHWLLIYKIAKFPISSQINILVTEYPNNQFIAKALSEHLEFSANSLDELKNKVMSWVDQSYHQEMRPGHINFKYTKEEIINLK